MHTLWNRHADTVDDKFEVELRNSFLQDSVSDLDFLLERRAPHSRMCNVFSRENDECCSTCLIEPASGESDVWTADRRSIQGSRTFFFFGSN